MTVDWRLLDERNEALLVAQLESAGVILKGHFELASGAHGDTFVNIKGLYPHPRVTKQFAHALAIRVQRELGDDINTLFGVAAPAIGGVVLAHDTADVLGQIQQELNREVIAIFAEKKERGVFHFLRGYDEYIRGHSFIIVEDVMTSGGSVKQIIELIRTLGGEVLLVVVIWNRGGVTPEDLEGVPVVSLINRRLPSWLPEDCRVDGPCAIQVQMDVKHGRGAAWVAEHGQFGAA